MIQPKKLNILGKDYEVIYEDRFNKSGVNNTGTHYGYSLKIWIDTKCHRQEQEESLLHEIIEAINSSCGLELPHQNVATLSTAFYQVLKDNGFLK